MLLEPNATQSQAILRLLFIPEEPAMSKLKPNLPAAKRKELIDAGVIELEKRGAAKHLVLTDRGWAWAAENLDKLCPRSMRQVHPDITRAILESFAKNMRFRELSLAEIVRPDLFCESANADHDETTIMQAIRDVCRRKTEGRPGDRLRLVDLRRELPHLPRSEVDQALFEMQSQGEIALTPLERFEIRPEDEQASLQVAGLPRHALFLK
jgi:hypothetical protein